MNPPPDVVDQLRRDFPAADVDARLEQLERATSSERVQRCVVFAARGHPWYFDFLCRLAESDSRDVIIAAEYERFGTRLYDFSRPLGQARIDDPHTSYGAG